jgi:hypothetical protein
MPILAGCRWQSYRDVQCGVVSRMRTRRGKKTSFLPSRHHSQLPSLTNNASHLYHAHYYGNQGPRDWASEGVACGQLSQRSKGDEQTVGTAVSEPETKLPALCGRSCALDRQRTVPKPGKSLLCINYN